jgi:hypothetical protein
MNMDSIAGGFITQQLSEILPTPDSLAALLSTSSLRLFDASMIIEDSLKEIAPAKEARIKQPLEQFDQTFVIDEIISKIKDEGLAPHFHNMIGLFGSIMMSLTATPSQLQQVEDWVNQGIFGHFLMTDKGGPSLANWRTQLSEQDGKWLLAVDKIHGIEAHNLGFSMVVARQVGKPFPVTIMLPPEVCSQLNQRAVGEAFVDGSLQLGNCSGRVEVDPSMMLSGGGLGSVNRFLTLVRPRFVKSLMHFLLWLKKQKELTLDQSDFENIEYIIAICNEQIAATEFSMHSVNRVLATKFASNELLTSLVLQGKVSTVERQRDLLAFSKMEGSSYRCFFEIYSKTKGLRL